MRPCSARSYILRKTYPAASVFLLLLACLPAHSEAEREEELKKLDRFGENYLSQNPQGEDAEEVRYMKALAQLKLGRHPEGRREMERLAARSSSAAIRAKAEAALKKDATR
jgi:hypothetical protein